MKKPIAPDKLQRMMWPQFFLPPIRKHYYTDDKGKRYASIEGACRICGQVCAIVMTRRPDGRLGFFAWQQVARKGRKGFTHGTRPARFPLTTETAIQTLEALFTPEDETQNADQRAVANKDQTDVQA